MKVLTAKQKETFSKALINDGVPVRFMKSGQVYNILTGDFTKGGNIISQQVYWNFTKETSKEIAELTGTKAIFSK